MDEEAAADDIDIADFRDWGDPERIAANVATLYREFDPSLPGVTPPGAVRAHGPLERAPLGPCAAAFTCQDHERGKQLRQEVN